MNFATHDSDWAIVTNRFIESTNSSADNGPFLRFEAFLQLCIILKPYAYKRRNRLKFENLLNGKSSLDEYLF